MELQSTVHLQYDCFLNKNLVQLAPNSCALAGLEQRGRVLDAFLARPLLVGEQGAVIGLHVLARLLLGVRAKSLRKEKQRFFFGRLSRFV
jgi:hypothetical protein